MTNREFYTAIVNYLDGADMDGVAIREFAVEALAKLDARNEKAKARPRKENAEVAGRKAAVAEFIVTHEGEFTADEIAEEIGKTVPMSPAAVASDSKHSKVTYKIGA